MLPDDRFASVLATKDAADFRAQVLSFTTGLGFDLMSAFVAVDKAVGGTDFYTVSNIPEGYLEAANDKENWRRDPVARHCKYRSTPLIWDQGTYVTDGLGTKWEEQAAFGFWTGIAIAMHLPDGKHFMLGVDREQPLPGDVVERRRLAGELCLFAAFAHEAAIGVLLPAPERIPEATCPLSARELEVLRWTADGKTAWEIGRILGISEQTIARHLGRAADKLGCVNKVEAVAKALRLRLVR